MSKQEARKQQISEWLEHLRRCEASGGSVVSYAKEHDLRASALYQWRSRLVREGLWPARTRKTLEVQRQVAPVSFARVTVTPPTQTFLVRLQLANGRRAEIAVTDLDPLIHLIGALEKQP
jgi:hypothetical protein